MPFCQKCGTQNQDGADFCSKCGASLTGKPLTTKEGTTTQAQKVSQPIQEGVSKNNSKRILLLLLVLFWPAGIIYYLVKMNEVRVAEEQNWFLNRPFVTWILLNFIIVFIVIAVVFIQGVFSKLEALALTQ